MSLVLNLLLLLAVLRRRRVVHVIYALSAAFLAPDVIFYTKVHSIKSLKAIIY